MCGLVGVAGALLTKDEGLIKRMLLIDYLRGMDATGLAALRNDGEIHIAKASVDPITLFDFPKFRTALNGNMSLVFLGHNRAQTRGINRVANAHPFQFDHIVGAHNGTLEWASHQAIEKELNQKFDVDSQAILAAIAAMGVKDALSLMKGSWSLTWIDTKENTLNFLRNKERPLTFAYNEDFNRLYWASESRFIEYAVETSGYNEKLWADKEGYRFWETTPDMHYKFSIDDLKKREYVKPTLTEVKGKEGNFFSSDGKKKDNKPDPFNRDEDWSDEFGQYGMYPHGMGNVLQISQELRKRAKEKAEQTSSTPSTTRSPRSKAPSPVVLVGNDDDPYAGRLSREDFEKIENHSGCSICAEPIPYGTQGITIYMRDSKILCPKHSLKGPENVTRIFALAK